MSHEERLLRKYCPPLEESLFIAIASDYDLRNEEQVNQLDQLLADLKEQAVVEQELELAPSLQQETSAVAGTQTHSRTASSNQRASTTDLEDTIASVTSGISDLHPCPKELDISHVEGKYTELPYGLEGGSTIDKQNWLKDLFPTIETIQIVETLARCNGDIQRSIDELLNLSFFHDDADRNYVPPSVPKGVEGFAGDGKVKKSKGKKTRRNQETDIGYLSDGAHSSGATTPSNIWRSAAEDVEFIVSRTHLPMAFVRSVYHQNNANIAQTIRALITQEVESHASQIKGDELLELQVAELRFELDAVPEIQIYGALLLARMIPSAAKDLLDVTLKRPMESQTGKLVAQYTPLNLSEDEAPKRTARLSTVPGDPALLAGKAGVHSVQASKAFSQASAAYRRGKSDHLMGAAAAYYAEIGHEQRKRHKELIASAADSLVGQQSTANSLDLHGVSVEHAVRIARNSVENWWERLGDRKYIVGGVGDGYKIIVGLGTHSAQGIGRIGPAVSKMLIREGWKVNIQRGEVFVEGRSRR
ncbi:hypothetical protein LTR05_005149 [Lithohypha guttulata]|uniref:Smr domain-containing protein n=1 Tax=Lithohypha guttulata TaxID=1690604 RepID=A0AAN7YH72_9EURO|nr:hypothetical protein LTR05_005149 [Lithohypha guttulata]